MPLFALAFAFQEPAPGAVTSVLGALPVGTTLRGLIMVLVGAPLVFLAARGAKAWMTSRMHPQAGLVAGKIVLYGGLIIVAVSTLRELGFSLAPLLGAAGILGIALGFASQTSVSNVISGLFLIAERPFVVDDLIEVGDVKGRVISIDTLSVQLRTFDNRMVRIPNETLVKSQMINVTRFPVRRVDVRLGVAYKEDPSRIREMLLDVARKNPMCLMEPAPIVVFEGFGASSIDFLFGVWATQQNFLQLKTSIHQDIKARFDAEGVEIPFPHRTLYVGSQSDPFPVRMVGTAPAEPDVSPPSHDSAP
ncbi:MAG: mechanosensitive ion channel family protein [Gemmatimonadota bacterium]